jgi:2'-5' RNA ligase
MKLFLAIQLETKIQTAIAQWREEHQLLPVVWTDPGDTHLTLVAPWEAEEWRSATPTIETALASHQPFELRLDHVTFGPPTRQARMLWATSPPNEPLTALHNDLTRALKQGFARPFLPHVTVAYFVPEQPPRFKEEPVTWKQRVTSVSLYHALGSQSTSRYRVLATFNLSKS